ncbi:MAG: LysM peptidoglycan-binding domain-containing protein [Nitrososphaerales archaeon]
MYCRRCGATLHQGVVICPECGARQRRGISSVRCARCGQRVSLGLTVCPHCGRDVHPAGPRWGLWLTGFAIIAVAALWGLGELPIERIRTEVASARTRVAAVVQFLGPVATPTARVSTPQALAELPDKPTEAPPEEEETAAVEAATAAVPEVEPTAAVTVEPTADMAARATQTAAAQPTSIPTPSPTLEPTATPSPMPTATLTPEPTATPTAAPTQAPAPAGRVTYKVRSGDTLSGIAARYGISWQDLATANGLTSRSTLRNGQELVIPVPGSAPAAAPNAAALSPSGAYKVKSGDSLSTIAAQFGMTWQELATANGLTAKSRLNVGQELVIPGKGGPTQALPTASPVPAPTSRPEPTVVALLSAPVLVNPADQASASGGSAFIELVWRFPEPGGLPAGAGYRVAILWTENGEPKEYLVPVTTATSIRMPSWLWQKADQPTRMYTWSVRLVETTTDGQGRERDILLSPSSETRTLYWY